MTVYQILCLCGVPTLFAAMFGYFHKLLKTNQTETMAIKCGIQALLRTQMISDWNKYSRKGFAPIYAKENFENVWQQYHSLGANGVMNDIHEKFLDLPTGSDENEK